MALQVQVEAKAQRQDRLRTAARRSPFQAERGGKKDNRIHMVGDTPRSRNKSFFPSILIFHTSLYGHFEDLTRVLLKNIF